MLSQMCGCSTPSSEMKQLEQQPAPCDCSCYSHHYKYVTDRLETVLSLYNSGTISPLGCPLIKMPLQ